MKCIYCLHETENSDFTLEHILPASLGGKLINHPILRTKRVCTKCNNLCGLFVDAAFQRSWFSHKANTELRLKFPAAHKNAHYPIYLGICEDLSTDQEYCDFWAWPRGSHVYHFYPRNEKYAAYVGGNPIHKNSSISFIVISEHDATNKKWIAETISSYLSFFNYSRCCGYNINLCDKDSRPILDASDHGIDNYKNRISKILGHTHRNRIHINLYSHKRFYSKLALGIGFNILGDDFLLSTNAQEFKNGLWYKPQDATPQIFGQDFTFSSNILNKIPKLYSWGYGNFLNIVLSGNRLFYVFGVYGQILTALLICRDTTKFSIAGGIPDSGLTFLWSSDLNTCLSPIPFADYMRYRQNHLQVPEIQDFEAQFLTA